MDDLQSIAMPLRVVLDTSVLVAALRSQNGASFAIVNSIPSPGFQPCLSVSLYAEWQAVLTRPEHRPVGINTDQILAFLRYLASQSQLQPVHYRWRPQLDDPDDDFVLELAVAAGCPLIVTLNTRDFRGSERFGVTPILPSDFLKLLRAR